MGLPLRVAYAEPEAPMSLPGPPEFERAVRERVASGQYENAEEVFEQALMALEEAEARAHREWLREQIDVGLAELDREEGIPWEEAKEHILATLKREGVI